MNTAFQDAVSGPAEEWISRRVATGDRRSLRVDFALWEWRAVASLEPESGGVRTEEDGGVRVEGRLADGRPGWRFEVGAGPEGIGGRVRRRAVDLLSSSQERAPVVRACVRLRAIGAPGTTRVSIDEGLVVEDPQTRVRRALHPGRLDEWRPGAAAEAAGGARGSVSWTETETPVVLEPAAAGRWAHEMVHAAMEGRFEVEANHGVEIVDDPAAAAWPAGFELDDLGQEATPWTAWSRGGSSPPPPAGHHRRASIRVAALPAATLTRVDVAPGSPRIVLADLPDGTPVIRTVGGGRYDPVTETILLSANASGQILHGAWVVDERDVVLEVSPERCWKGLRAVSPPDEVNPSLATCLRQGLMHAVMVGAPTLVLESARLCLRERRSAAVPSR